MAKLSDPYPKKSMPNGHPMDGTTLEVDVGGAWVSIPDPRAEAPVGWHLTWGNVENARYVAASLISSYAYLLSGEINQAEATRRLKMMRATWKEAIRARSAISTTSPEGENV